MPSLLLTFAILAIWTVQGIGFVPLFVPTAPGRPMLVFVLAAWCGLIANLLVLTALYFLIPRWTIGELTWPVTAGLAAVSIVLTWRRMPRPTFEIDGYSVVIALCVFVALVLVLRPLVDQSHLGYFESFNGEFMNYAAMADVTQFHDAATSNGGFPTLSREGIAGVACGTICAITGRPAPWVIEPYAAALAALAFSSLGLLFHQILQKRRAGRQVSAITGLIYVCMIWSAATTFFWTLSFVSQYLSLAIFLPTLLFLSERTDNDRRTTIGLGIVLGALLCVYWEMFIPNVALLAAFHFIRAAPGARLRAIGTFAAALVLGLLVAHRFSYDFVLKATHVGTSGWNMYGDHRHVLQFVSNVTGFTSPYNDGTTYSAFAVVLALIGFAASFVYSAVRAWREPEPTVRALLGLGCLFYVGVAVAFVLVAKRGAPNNYVAAKVLLGYGWLAYVLLAITAIDFVRWRPRLVGIPLAIALLFFAGLSRGALRFAKSQHRVPLYLESDGEGLRERLHGRRPFVAAPQYSTEIVGRFVIYGRDVLEIDGQWPGFPATFVPGAPVLLVADRKLSDVKGITGNYLPSWWHGRFVLFEAR